ncbi:hypothetical protein CPB86DRAFT_800211 [Serendipita vermifera]|nr:hypothetical protein CPB86DRAFT_800211 [Serendipita vermifera]
MLPRMESTTVSPSTSPSTRQSSLPHRSGPDASPSSVLLSLVHRDAREPLKVPVPPSLLRKQRSFTEGRRSPKTDTPSLLLDSPRSQNKRLSQVWIDHDEFNGVAVPASATNNTGSASTSPASSSPALPVQPLSISPVLPSPINTNTSSMLGVRPSLNPIQDSKQTGARRSHSAGPPTRSSSNQNSSPYSSDHEITKHSISYLHREYLHPHHVQ